MRPVYREEPRRTALNKVKGMSFKWSLNPIRAASIAARTREHFPENLARDWPELLPEYERLYNGRAYLPRELGDPVRCEVARLRTLYGIGERQGPPIVSPGAEAAPGETREEETQLPLAM